MDARIQTAALDVSNSTIFNDFYGTVSRKIANPFLKSVVIEKHVRMRVQYVRSSQIYWTLRPRYVLMKACSCTDKRAGAVI